MLNSGIFKNNFCYILDLFVTHVYCEYFLIVWFAISFSLLCLEEQKI